MKCPKCGGIWDEGENRCLSCGVTAMMLAEPITEFGRKIGKKMRFGNLEISFLGICFVFALNVSILGLIGNILSYFSGFHVLWAQYVVAGVYIAYLILKLFSANRLQIVGIVRNTVYVLCLALFRYGLIQDQNWYFGYFVPSVFILLDLFVLVMLFCRMTNSGTFLLTTILNGVFAVGIVLLKSFSVITVPPFGSAFLFVAVGVSALMILNFIIFHILSAATWLSKRL